MVHRKTEARNNVGGDTEVPQDQRVLRLAIHLDDGDSGTSTRGELVRIVRSSYKGNAPPYTDNRTTIIGGRVRVGAGERMCHKRFQVWACTIERRHKRLDTQRSAGEETTSGRTSDVALEKEATSGGIRDAALRGSHKRRNKRRSAGGKPHAAGSATQRKEKATEKWFGGKGLGKWQRTLNDFERDSPSARNRLDLPASDAYYSCGPIK
ncbi:hypothetical protein B0H13DRAFT_1895147 [Mycena leptocephala]|nr:hypothetical protein B0H13DRAFT_1895147 [Mycena leptocephala]